jgi:hypothetical protein
LLCCSLVRGLTKRDKLFFCESARNKENAVNVPQGRVVGVVNGGDEAEMFAKLFLKRKDGLPGDVG